MPIPTAVSWWFFMCTVCFHKFPLSRVLNWPPVLSWALPLVLGYAGCACVAPVVQPVLCWSSKLVKGQSVNKHDDDDDDSNTTLNLCLLHFSTLASLKMPIKCFKSEQLMSSDSCSSFIFWSDCFLLPALLPPGEVDWKPPEAQSLSNRVWCSLWESHTKSNIRKQGFWDYSGLRNIKPPLSSAEDFQANFSVRH